MRYAYPPLYIFLRKQIYFAQLCQGSVTHERKFGALGYGAKIAPNPTHMRITPNFRSHLNCYKTSQIQLKLIG
jgi:hypothetical protein